MLRSVENLVGIGLSRSRVLMINEAHSGLRRCIRTRLIGLDVLRAAHAFGCRRLAAEVLTKDVASRANEDRVLPRVHGGYLAHPEMRALLSASLELKWELIAYEAINGEGSRGAAHPVSEQVGRDAQQARNLASALTPASILVWAGWSHIYKGPAEGTMGSEFARLTSVMPFCIDQTVTVTVERPATVDDARLADELGRSAVELRRMGGTAGYLREEDPDAVRRQDSRRDAVLLSIENDMS